MSKSTNDTAKALSDARRKNAAAMKARYEELDLLTGMTAAERIAELNKSKHARK